MTNSSKKIQTIPSPAPRLRFGLSDRIAVGEIDYAPHSSDDFSQVLIRMATGLPERFSHEEIQQLRDSGELKLFRNHNSPTRLDSSRGQPEVKLNDLGAEQRGKVLWRKDICDRFLRMEAARETSRSDIAMRPAIATINAEIAKTETERQASSGRCGSSLVLRSPPSPTMLRKWLRKYEACNFDALVLRDNYGRCGNRQPRLDDEVQQLVKDFAATFADARKPSKALVYSNLVREIKKQNDERLKNGDAPLTLPSRRALDREIAKLDAYFVYAGRESEEKAKKKFYIVRGGLDVRLPLERVEMDEWCVSLQTLLMDAGVWSKLPRDVRRRVAKVRVWVSVAIDAATRCILAIHVISDSPSANSAVATLQMAVSDKRALAKAAGCTTPWDMSGPPDTISTDTGSSWFSYEFRAAGTDLGSEVMFAPVGMPQMRARIERVFSTMHTQLIARFDGRTFENSVVKGEYDSEARVTIDVEELTKMLIRYVVDVYHNEPHGGLGGETPRNAWLRLVRDWGVPPAPDPDQMRDIFGTTLERRITSEGIEFLGNQYQDDELARRRRQIGQKPVLIRVDQLDLGHISVRLPEGWLTVECQRQGMNGVSVKDWQETSERLRRTYADQAAITEDVVQQALGEIQDFADKAIARAEIDPPTYTREQLAKLERRLELGSRIERGSEEDGDFLEVAEDAPEDPPTAVPRLPLDPKDSANSESNAPDEQSDDDIWSMED